VLRPASTGFSWLGASRGQSIRPWLLSPGHRLARQHVRAGIAGQAHRAQGFAQLLLEHAAAIRGGEGHGQLLGGGVAIGG